MGQDAARRLLGPGGEPRPGLGQRGAGSWIPGIEVEFSDQEIRAVLSVSPVTTDETTIGRIVALGEAAWRFHAPQADQPDIRRAFRTILIGAARKNRQFWIDRQRGWPADRHLAGLVQGRNPGGRRSSCGGR